MNLRTVYDAIATVENQFDVGALELGGVNVWIPLRDIFIVPFVNHRRLAYREVLGARSHISPMTAGRPMPRLDRGNIDVEFRRIGGHSYFRTTPLDLPSDPDLMFFHAFQDYSDIEDNGCYNRIADNVLELYHAPERCVKVVRANPASMGARFTHPAWQYVDDSSGTHLRSPVSGETALLRELDRIVEFSNRAGIETVYQPEAVINRLRKLLWRAEQFERLLERCRPRAVILSSYAHIERMAMVVAARRARVTTVDVEHGFMGYLSPYGRLGCVPAEGWDCLPDYFWVWGDESSRLLERSLGAAAQVHRPVLGGSPQHQRHRHAEAPVLGAVSERLHRMKDAVRRVALFCWQPDMLVHEDIPRLLPSSLEAAMRLDPQTLWLIRMHPRSRHLIPKVERRLADVGHDNFEVELATTDPLPQLIDFADVVLTSYSTVAFEANDRRRPVVLVDDVGIGMMEDYVEREVFAAGTDGPSLLAAMDAALARQVDPIDYIHDDPTSHVAAFQTILERPVR